MVSTSVQCIVCERSDAQLKSSTFDGVHIACEQCGEYRVTGSAYDRVKGFGEEQRERIFWWLSRYEFADQIPTINTDNLTAILAARLPTFSQRVERFLLALDRATIVPGKRLPAQSRELRRGAGLLNDGSYAYLLNALREAKYIHNYTEDRIALTSLGFEKVEGLLRATPDSSQAFVAMWFSEEMESAWKNGLCAGIASAGYDPFRISQKEHINKICDEIISEIRRSVFIVADYTEHRGGVYYEAGFAAGMGLPVINTCRKGHMGDLHFDIQQYNCIDWETESELSDRLRKRIEAVIGCGPLPVVEI